MIDKSTVSDWQEKTIAVILLSAAVLGLLYEALHIFGREWVAMHLGGGEQAIIFLVALLCGGLGLERFVVLGKLRASIEAAREDSRSMLFALAKIENALDTPIKAEALIGTMAIEEAARKIIRASGDSDDIIATSQNSSRDLLSEDYINALAERVKRAQDAAGEMEYRLVIPAKSGSRSELEDRRSEVFRQKHIQDRLVTKRARHPLPLEVLIVGNSMIIALRGGSDRPTYEVAIKIEGSEFVSKAANWFREVVWEDAERASQNED